MTEVEFHFNLPDRIGYACRLLRKASRKQVGCAVTGPSATLDAFDRLLWTHGDTEFLPHLRVGGSAVPASRLRRTPVWLVDRPEQAGHLPVLVNLGEDPPEGFESFGRLIELVGMDDEGREAARRRWRHYAGRGYPITRHEGGSPA
jgi:DNA polymerase-3 subunit chi